MRAKSATAGPSSTGRTTPGLLDPFLAEGRLMRPVAELPDAGRGPLLGVFTDIDDTLTSDGRLPAAPTRRWSACTRPGLAVAPITGRPAGWCDAIARLWPVRGVVGENGAFFFAYDGANRRMIRRFEQDAETRAEGRRKLAALAERIRRRRAGQRGRRRPGLSRIRPRHRLLRGRAPAPGRGRGAHRSPCSRKAGATAKVSSITSTAGSAPTTSCP
jgi:hypothetical protein